MKSTRRGWRFYMHHHCTLNRQPISQLQDLDWWSSGNRSGYGLQWYLCLERWFPQLGKVIPKKIMRCGYLFHSMAFSLKGEAHLTACIRWFLPVESAGQLAARRLHPYSYNKFWSLPGCFVNCEWEIFDKFLRAWTVNESSFNFFAIALRPSIMCGMWNTWSQSNGKEVETAFNHSSYTCPWRQKDRKT